MKIWRLVLDIIVVVTIVTGVVAYNSNDSTATVLAVTGLGAISALGAGLIGELAGVLIGKDDFSTKAYLISVAAGAVFALVLSLIIM